tara:strand:- start:26107 stop:26466 length:360 start_codon:yes stop_codon:yes gene_type:complete
MAGTILTNFSISSTTTTTDNLNISLNDTISVTNPVQTGRLDVTTGGIIPIAAAGSLVTYVYLKNLDPTNWIFLKKGDNTTWGKLHPGEFAFFPIYDGLGLKLTADTATCKVEYGFWTKA